MTTDFKSNDTMVKSNDDPLLECPVCFEALVCPYSIACGHTICSRCFNFLRANKCPVCRYNFISKKKCSVNLLLHTLLEDKIPNYKALSDKYNLYTKSANILYQYRKSIRYNTNKKTLKDFLSSHNYTYLFSEFVAENASIPEIEIKYICDHADNITKITIGDSDYIVDAETINNIIPIIDILKNKGCTAEHTLHILSINDDSILPIAQCLGIKYKKELWLEDTVQFSTYLIKGEYDLTTIPKTHHEDDEWGSRSGSGYSDSDDELEGEESGNISSDSDLE
jgi:hypothetical protein